MSCDWTCRNSSGNLNSPGYVLNFVEVADFSNNNGYFIRAGYETDPSMGGLIFFEDYHTAQQTYSLGFEGPAVDYSNNRNPPPFFVRVLIFGLTGLPSCPNRLWLDTLEFTVLGGVKVLDAAMCSTFKPNVWVMGQYLFGTKGASAHTATFENNLYSTIPRVVNCACVPYNPLTPKDAVFLTKDGTLVSRGAPPYAGWDVRPHVANSEGGSFYAECCQPPP
jgi:hypothetical protein